MNHKEQIENLKDGESYTIPEGDYGRGIVWKQYTAYFLFSIPIYGGEPVFHKWYNSLQVDKMIEEFESWT